MQPDWWHSHSTNTTQTADGPGGCVTSPMNQIETKVRN